jgi:hypothetical protein
MALSFALMMVSLSAFYMVLLTAHHPRPVWRSAPAGSPSH